MNDQPRICRHCLRPEEAIFERAMKVHVWMDDRLLQPYRNRLLSSNRCANVQAHSCLECLLRILLTELGSSLCSAEGAAAATDSASRRTLVRRSCPLYCCSSGCEQLAVVTLSYSLSPQHDQSSSHSSFSRALLLPQPTQPMWHFAFGIAALLMSILGHLLGGVFALATWFLLLLALLVPMWTHLLVVGPLLISLCTVAYLYSPPVLPAALLLACHMVYTGPPPNHGGVLRWQVAVQELAFLTC